MADQAVVMDIMGGLGNQMFQYAAGKALALRTGAHLLLNVRPLASDGKRDYSLHSFSVPDQCVDIPLPRRPHRWQRALNRIYPFFRNTTVTAEPHFHYWDGFGELQSGVRLRGYWASPRYFAGYEANIRRAFSFPDLSPAAADVQAEMRNAQSVSIHLRLGDYLTKETAAFHGNLGLEYYARAAALMRRMLPECRFFVFSDDPPAAREFFREWANVAFVETGSQIDDMHLMSCCAYHIIANSTYSWWGAWLAGNDGGIVIAPRHWFARKTMMHTYTLDLIPEKWIIV